MCRHVEVGGSGRRPADAAQARAHRTVPALAESAPDAVTVTSVALPGPAGPLALRVYRPRHVRTRGAGLGYLHGGGFVVGGLDSHHGALCALADTTGHVVVAVDYWLVPEHPLRPPWRTPRRRCVRSPRTRGDFGTDAGRLSVAGDSARAMLAAVVAQSSRTRGASYLAHQMLIIPLTAFPPYVDTASGRELAQGDTSPASCWTGTPSAMCPTPPLGVHPTRAAPGRGLPPAIVITGGLDILHDEGERYARDMAAAGVDVRVRRLRDSFHLLWLAMALAPAAQAEVFSLVDERLAP
ncbi:alpha/beta hydrolase fold domain-containing protein [Streptomyces pseudogriseolus]|uniref:alpha/beta hydrolase fold domain-containing protein n=1 Tax=Streptomyces pseudogriseolus TaxID=36817 RepID=UPI003FA2D584